MRNRHIFNLVELDDCFGLSFTTFFNFTLFIKISDVSGFLIFPRMVSVPVTVTSFTNGSVKSYIRHFRLFKSRYGYYILFKSVRYYFPVSVVFPGC